MRVLALALAAMLAACGGTGSTPTASPTPTPQPSVTWPPAPASSPGPSQAEAWTWSDATSADVALVDRLCAIWTNHDVAASADLYADGAQMVFRSMTQPGDMTMIKAGILGSPDTYKRDGGVLVSTPTAAAWPGLPEGGRILFFEMRVSGTIVGSWLLVNGAGRIVMDWEDETK